MCGFRKEHRREIQPIPSRDGHRFVIRIPEYSCDHPKRMYLKLLAAVSAAGEGYKRQRCLLTRTEAATRNAQIVETLQKLLLKHHHKSDATLGALSCRISASLRTLGHQLVFCSNRERCVGVMFRRHQRCGPELFTAATQQCIRASTCSRQLVSIRPPKDPRPAWTHTHVQTYIPAV